LHGHDRGSDDLNVVIFGEMMKKTTTLLFLALFILVGCSGEHATNNTYESKVVEHDDDKFLIFNEAERVIAFSPEMPNDLFFRDLTAEEAEVLFHDFDIIPARVRAVFIKDNGSLDSILVSDESTGVRIGVGGNHGIEMDPVFDGEPIVTYINEIPVTAYFADLGGASGLYFQVYFRMVDTGYTLRLDNPDFAEGRKLLSETVYSIIQNHGIDLTLVRDGSMANAKSSDDEFTVFYDEEIGVALDLVRLNFEVGGDLGICELKALWYDETFSETEKRNYITRGRGSVNDVDIDNVIILRSEFHVPETGACPSFEPDTTYNWMWILIRDSHVGEWRIDDKGY